MGTADFVWATVGPRRWRTALAATSALHSAPYSLLLRFRFAARRSGDVSSRAGGYWSARAVPIRRILKQPDSPRGSTRSGPRRVSGHSRARGGLPPISPVPSCSCAHSRKQTHVRYGFQFSLSRVSSASVGLIGPAQQHEFGGEVPDPRQSFELAQGPFGWKRAQPLGLESDVDCGLCDRPQLLWLASGKAREVRELG
jgi:hypothetical protein